MSGWTTPKTDFAVGDTLTAAEMNAIGDDLTYLLPGTIIAYGTNTSSVTTTGTTFAAGADVLASALSFTADGTSDYIVTVIADQFSNSGTATTRLILNLDGADAGFMAAQNLAAGVAVPLNASTPILAPSAGAHTVNVRMDVSAGTGTVKGGSGGAGVDRPILVTLKVA